MLPAIVAERYWWENWRASLGSELRLVCIVVGAAILVYFFINNGLIFFWSLATPKSELPIFRSRLSRVAAALALAFAGLHVGSNYAHLCDAGSRLIEIGAFLGTPLVAGAIAFFVKRRVVGILLAILVIAVVLLLQRPYLDWAHGN